MISHTIVLSVVSHIGNAYINVPIFIVSSSHSFISLQYFYLIVVSSYILTHYCLIVFQIGLHLLYTILLKCVPATEMPLKYHMYAIYAN